LWSARACRPDAARTPPAKRVAKGCRLAADGIGCLPWMTNACGPSRRPGRRNERCRDRRDSLEHISMAGPETGHAGDQRRRRPAPYGPTEKADLKKNPILYYKLFSMGPAHRPRGAACAISRRQPPSKAPASASYGRCRIGCQSRPADRGRRMYCWIAFFLLLLTTFCYDVIPA
jgi:hypothetical protein